MADLEFSHPNNMEPKEYTGPKELLQIIDREINMHIGREEDFDIGQLVGSYDMAENYRPIVKQYVTDVYKLFSRTFKKVIEDVRETRDGIRCLGAVVSTAVGAGIGGVVGYLVDGPLIAGAFAYGGAMIGFFVEVIFPLSAFFITHKYLDSQIEGCKGPRAIYRNKTLLQLENLS